jgi:hypothetical protein
MGKDADRHPKQQRAVQTALKPVRSPFPEKRSKHACPDPIRTLSGHYVNFLLFYVFCLSLVQTASCPVRTPSPVLVVM